MKILSKSAAQTKRVAARLAKKLLQVTDYGLYASVVALTGDLGSGKTTFAQGFAKTLGIKPRVVSPTFLIFRRYKISKNFQDFYHVDLYRINNIKQLDILKFKEILKNPQNIVLIEWAERIKKFLPKNTIWVEFNHGRKENERLIAY